MRKAAFLEFDHMYHCSDFTKELLLSNNVFLSDQFSPKNSYHQIKPIPSKLAFSMFLLYRSPISVTGDSKKNIRFVVPLNQARAFKYLFFISQGPPINKGGRMIWRPTFAALNSPLDIVSIIPWYNSA